MPSVSPKSVSEKSPRSTPARATRAATTRIAAAPTDAHAWSLSALHAFAGAVAFFSDLSAFALMKRSVLACASLSTIWTGGDCMR
jgi:hypothetical protein